MGIFRECKDYTCEAHSSEKSCQGPNNQSDTAGSYARHCGILTEDHRVLQHVLWLAAGTVTVRREFSCKRALDGLERVKTSHEPCCEDREIVTMVEIACLRKSRRGNGPSSAEDRRIN